MHTNLTGNKQFLYKGRANSQHPASEVYLNTREDFVGPHGKTFGRLVGGVGNMAYLNQEKSATENGIVSIHETFHNFGLGDRYIENVLYKWFNEVSAQQGSSTITVAYPGFENDMMSNNSLSNFNQIHIDNLVLKALELNKSKGNNFIMAVKVDSAASIDKDSAPNTFTSGKTVYTKVDE